MSYRVVITGFGAVSPYGIGVEALWQGLKSSKNPLKFSEALDVVVGAIPTINEDPKYGLVSSKWSTGQLREMSRATLLTMMAAEEALRDSGLESYDHTETGVNIGMGISDLEAIHDAGTKIDNGKTRTISPYFIPKILTNIPAGYVSLKYGMKGGNSSSTTACATGARPFDKDREGFVMSEGVGVVLLERADDAIRRSAKIYAEVLGYGLGNDAFHLTAPNVGIGSTLSIQRGLRDAKIDLNELDSKYNIYVNAHATSTPVGDISEVKSLEEILPGVKVSSHIGHTLGAAGSIETMASCLSMNESLLIGTLNLENPISDKISIIRGVVPWEDERNRRKLIIKNSFGFGGAYVSLILSEFIT